MLSVGGNSTSVFFCVCNVVVGKLWAVRHVLLSRATLTVVASVVCESYCPAPVAWDKV